MIKSESEGNLWCAAFVKRNKKFSQPYIFQQTHKTLEFSKGLQKDFLSWKETVYSFTYILFTHTSRFQLDSLRQRVRHVN